MVSAAQRERLRWLSTCDDFSALPMRAILAEPEKSLSDNDEGGVSLDPSAEASRARPESKQPVPDPARPLLTASEENQERQFVWLQGQQSSYNLGSNPKLSTLPTIKLPPPTLRKGDLAPARAQFTPIGALAKYPYSFANRNLSQDLATHFWDQGM